MAVSFVLILVGVFHCYVSCYAITGMPEITRHFFPSFSFFFFVVFNLSLSYSMGINLVVLT